jgi:hypothetical protein
MNSKSPNDPYAEWYKLTPRERMFTYALERIGSLEARATAECKEPSCGERDKDGDKVSCSSPNCGEKQMLAGWRRELQFMRDITALVHALERRELEQKAAADKGGRRR